METTVVEQCNTHVQLSRHISSKVYANDEKCRYTSAFGHIVDCSKLICGIYLY